MWKEGVITFDSGLKKEILEMFGKTVDEEGYIVETNDPSVRVITPEGEEIYIEEFAGIRMKNGAEIFIKSNLPALIQLIDDLKQESGFFSDEKPKVNQIPFEYELLTDDEYWEMRHGWREAKHRNREARYVRGEKSFYGYEDVHMHNLRRYRRSIHRDRKRW
jgi:hypothetical protein